MKTEPFFTFFSYLTSIIQSQHKKCDSFNHFLGKWSQGRTKKVSETTPPDQMVKLRAWPVLVLLLPARNSQLLGVVSD